MVIDMKNLYCKSIEKLNRLFEYYNSNNFDNMSIEVLNFNPGEELEVLGMVASANISRLEFKGSKPVKITGGRGMFKYAEYGGYIDFNNIFGAFDTSEMVNAVSMFDTAVINNDIEIHDIDFNKLIYAKKMFHCLDASNIYIRNVKFSRLEEYYGIFEGVYTNSFILDNVDFSNIGALDLNAGRIDKLGLIFSGSSIHEFTIYPNCKWPSHKRYSRYDILSAIFSECEIFRAVISKQDKELERVLNEAKYVELINYLEDELC